ncbi:hypothetical protein HYT45_02480 [Candidatus Uhrbacteria bacterium]|nr:hypothetical protein [Candidatus Uhrbacteria bacterium]
MRNFKNNFLSLLRKSGIGLIASLLLPFAVFAVTTISTNLATDGSLTVSSTSATSTFSGDVLISGVDIQFGNATSDRVWMTGRLASSLLPTSNASLDLGAYVNAWRNIYASGTLYAGGVSTSTLDNVVIGGSTRAAGNFTNLDFNGTGVLGDGGDDIAINSNDWDISSTGVASNLSLATSTIDNMTVGAVTASTGAFTTLSSTGVFTPTGGIATSTIDNITVGAVTRSTGAFTALSSTGVYTPTGGIATSTIDNITVGAVTRSTGAFTVLSSTGVFTPTGGIATSTIDNMTVGAVTPLTGAFTVLSSTGVFTPTGGIATSTINNTIIGGSTRAAGNFTSINASSSIAFGANAATTTVNIASNTAAVGQGTCVPLRATDGTLIYLSATSSPSALAPWTVLALSTTSCQ